MSFTKIEIPKEILPREKIESILAGWEKKRKGLLSPLLFPDSSKRQLFRIEKVYIPHYLFIFHQPVFPALVSQEKALAKAKDWLSKWNIRKHAFHLKLPELLSSRVRFLHLPFWVGYYQRPKGRVDIEVVDGVQGFLEGGRTQYLVKQGYAALQDSGTTKG
jgi:hypothetical protein